MNRFTSAVAVAFCTILALLSACRDAPSGPAADQSPSPQYDFFPPLAIGDTISWDYRHTGPYTPDYSQSHWDANGIMTWTVVDKHTTDTSTTLQVSQLFRGEVMTGYYPRSYSIATVDGALATIFITEDSLHMITIAGSTSGIRTGSWYAPPTARFPRFQPAAPGDTIMTTATSTDTVKARKGLGPLEMTHTILSGSSREDVRYTRRTISAPPDSVPVDPLRWGDFFPPFHTGGTATWDYVYRYTSISAPGYTVRGTMRWTVTSVAATPAGSTAQITQTLDAVLITWRFAGTWVPDTTRITNMTSAASITEEPTHVVTAHIPLVWRQGSPASLVPCTFAAARFGYNNFNDDLVATTNTSTATGSIQLVRDAGPIRITCREYGMSYGEVTMQRRQEY